MAENKKGFLLYADQKELFDQLPNEIAGELIKHIFSYVNDENPKTDNLLITTAFIPFKQQFKRDLDKWETTRGKRSLAGKKSAEARKNKRQQELTNSTSVKFVEQNPTNVNKRQQTSTNPTVNDNVNVNVNVNDNVIEDNMCKTPLDAVTHKQTDDEFLRFCNYIATLEKVKEIKEQISFENFLALKNKYPKDLIGEKLEELNNWLLDPNIPNSKKKKKSVYHLMVNTWLKNKY